MRQLDRQTESNVERLLRLGCIPALDPVWAFENQFDQVVLAVLRLPFRVPMLDVGMSEETMTSLANKARVRSHSCLWAIQGNSIFNVVFLSDLVSMSPVKLIIAHPPAYRSCDPCWN